MPRHWLFKTEPETFSIDDLARDGTTEWSGVRNFQARNLMREMKLGDLGFFYHSSISPPGVVGICKVVAEAHPDSSQFVKKGEYWDPSSSRANPKWWCVDVGFVEKFPRMIAIEELRAIPDLAYMPLLRRGQRLSVQPVSDQEWALIVRLGREA
ncbi:EVE domain-containing protein [Vulcanimicrobium alpinum]|uniref:EVE domain-containing protein n=1 Tax=Vulcanimicrobium alpinum TaxID=3016050 RepID=A0AAN1XSW0_UNVUL|nr:EVE domain-containing protein [Vulcanimicrobium alpinum]BDE05148.1 EVE domain-containing protein [Vulcanimicrobium alpinum]